MTAPSVAPPPPAPAARTARKRSPLRTFGSAVFGIIGVVGVLASLFSLWARDVMFDPDKVAAAVADSLDDPAVRDGIATYLTDQLLAVVDANLPEQGRLGQVVELLNPLVGPEVRGRVHGAFEGALERPGTKAVVADAARRSHRAVMTLLEEGSLVEGLRAEDGEVTVNLLPLYARGLEVVKDQGLLPLITPPTLTDDQTPAEQRTLLADALHLELPPDFGQLVVLRGDAVTRGEELVALGQQGLVIAKRAIVAVLLLTVVALGLSVALAVNRRRTLAWLGLASAIVLFLGRLGIDALVDRAPRLAIQPGARSAISSVLQSLATGLLTLVTVGLIVGVVVGLGAVLLGRVSALLPPRRSATAPGDSF